MVQQFCSILLNYHPIFLSHFVQFEPHQQLRHRTALSQNAFPVKLTFYFRAIAYELSPFFNLLFQFLVELLTQVDVRLKVLVHFFRVFLESIFSYGPQPLNLAFFVVFFAMGGVPAVVSVVFCQSQRKYTVFRIEKKTFLFQLLDSSLIDLLYTDKFLVFLDCFIQSLLVKLLTQFFLLEQSNKLFVGLDLQAFLFFTFFTYLFVLFYYLPCLIKTIDEFLNFVLILRFEVQEDVLHFRESSFQVLFGLKKDNVILGDGLIFSAVETFFLQYFCDEFVDMSFSYFLLIVRQFVLHRAFSHIFILFQSRDHRAEGILLIVKVLPEIDDFILKFDHSFIIEAFVFETHLFLHEKEGVQVLIFFIVTLEIVGELLCLVDELVDGCQIGPEAVNFLQAFILQAEVLLQIFQVMVAFDAFTLEELDLVLLGFISDQYLLDIAHVAVLHQILQSN